MYRLSEIRQRIQLAMHLQEEDEMPARDIAYRCSDMEMLAYFAAPEQAGPWPGILLVHGALGLDDFIIGIANRLSAQGLAVLALDLWGNRKRPSGPAEIGEQLDGCLGDRKGWMERVHSAQALLAAQPEADAEKIGALGYCFGGSTVLEYVRTGGDIVGAVSFHGGLDVVLDDWSAASPARVMICTGNADPMATPSDLERVTSGMTTVGTRWEADLYSGVKHAFTEPDAPGRPPFAQYDSYADRRSWAAMSHFFALLFS